MDVVTLLVAVLVNASLMSLALVVCVGLRVRSGLQSWQYALLAQAGGFGLLILSNLVAPLLLATLGAATLSASASLMLVSIGRFTGHQPPRALLVATPLLLGVVHVPIAAYTVHAVALTNAVIGLQVLHGAWLLLHGAGRTRWRWLCGVAAAANGVLMLGRVVLVLGWPAAYPYFMAPHPYNFVHLMLLNASLVLGTMGFLLAHRDVAEQALVKLASLDVLTGLLNRREWMLRATRALHDGGEDEPASVLMMIDLDHFKRVNDEHGHPVGDAVLKLTGEVLRSELRATDLVGRYGGEEFCVLLRHCEPGVFGRLDARLHQALKSRCEAAQGFVVDFSAGAVRVQPGETLAAAIQRADDRLYDAKNNGRGHTACAAGVL